MKKKLEKVIKQIIGMSIMIVMMLSLSACEAPLTKEAIAPQDKQMQSSEDTKSLVVYFSWSGDTKAVADKIKEKVNGDIFRILTKKEYAEDYNTVSNEAWDEQAAKARPELLTHIDNLDQYDTIFIGYPNWWNDMPMAVYTFLDEYDLSGKTIVPFCTYGAGGVVDTVDKMKLEEPNATYLPVLEIRGRDAENSDSKINDWLEKIEFKNK